MDKQPPPGQPISDVKLGPPKYYPNSLGDTWDPTWAADGALYFPGNDGSGWDKACASNVFFNCASGDDFTQLAGQTINGMFEFDGWSKRGPDGCTWKSSGCIAIDGTLYLALARHDYGTNSGDPFMRQTAVRSSIIKSTDLGATWTRPASENYANPMFPARFATPYFIHYGQDGRSPEVDKAERYIYAISNNGFWSNGDNYILGRVARTKIADLDPADWEFYQGGDGMQDSSWAHQMDHAVLIIDNPLKCGETGATYIPALGRYVLVAWYYPGNPNIDSEETHFIYYESPAPWGPWRIIKEDIIRPEGWYCPRILAKWQNPTQDGVETVLVTGGDYYEQDKYYRFTVVPLTLKAGGKFPEPAPLPTPTIISHDQIGKELNQVAYTGSWQVRGERTKALKGSEAFSETAGDAFTIRFTGTRLKWYASKENNLGIAAISLDNAEAVETDLYTFAVVPLYGRLVYDSGPLHAGEHIFNVSVTGRKNANSKGSGIYHDRVEVTS